MKKYLFSTHPIGFDLSLLVFRAFISVMMIPHGWNKWIHFDEKKAKFMDFMGFGHETSLLLVILAELICPCLILLGLGTRLAIIPVVIAMSVAVFDAHDGEIFGDGSEAFLYLLGFGLLFFTGPGKYALDRKIKA